MSFVAGQGVLGRITFKDGINPEYNRTYLIITAMESYIEVLNVSSIRGKERKLAFPTNERLKVYQPPFLKPCFVKLDSLTRINASEWNTLQLLYNGQTLEATELTRIRAMI